MPRTAFDNQLAALHADTVTLFEQAQTAVGQAVEAFINQDVALARRVVTEDAGINRMEHKILGDATTLLALQAPVASDLRHILGVSRVVGYLERIGDHARSIARTTIRMTGTPPATESSDLQVLIDAMQAMLREGLRCYESSDAALAATIPSMDEAVDRSYGGLFRELLSRMVTDAGSTTGSTYTLLAARDLERIADYVKNVAEAVIYVVTGRSEEMN